MSVPDLELTGHDMPRRTTRIKLRFDPDDAHPIIHRLEEREQSEHGSGAHQHIDLVAVRRAA